MKVPAADAYEVHRKFWNNSGGNSPLPIDPATVASNMGIRVVTQAHGHGVLRHLNNPTESTGTIGIADGLSHEDENLEIAREIGQVIFVQKYGRESDINVSLEYAKRFAAALLMPKSVIQRLQGLGMTPKQLASRLHVTEAVMEQRLANIRETPESAFHVFLDPSHPEEPEKDPQQLS